MKFRNLFRTFTVFSAVFAAAAGVLLFVGIVRAQTGTPKQETLLNGLKVLMWPDSRADSVSVRIRIHSGSAFDPQGKEGVMQLLADNLFPNEAAREFFTDDLGGSLEVKTTYDYIEVIATSRPEHFLTMLETVSTSVSNPQIDKETTAKLRSALIKKLEGLENDPAYIADSAVARRLFGTFPYGRPQMGTVITVTKIDFADLIEARQKFMTADNATVAVIGNFDRAVGFRAVRRYFGSWLKSDKKVPWTFRQPDEPPSAPLKISSPKPEIAALRFAVRGAARGDKDFAASELFAAIIDTRLKGRVPAAYVGGVSVSNQPHVLPGIIVIRMDAARKVIGNTDGKNDAEDTIAKVLSGPVSNVELEAARKMVRNEMLKRDLASIWLDADTYKFEKPEAYASAIDGVSLADITEYAERVRKLPMAIVAVITPHSAN